MDAFEQFPMLTIFVLVVAAFVVVSIIKSWRGASGQNAGRAPAGLECPQCGATPPARARFCNRCGKKL